MKRWLLALMFVLPNALAQTYPVNLQTGADILHIPYKGSGPATADAVSGQVQVTYASVASALRFVQAGRLRALEHPLDAAQLAELDRLFRPPTGAQPLEML